MRILLVEDEIKVGNALSKGLQAEGYEITWAQTGEEGFFHASSHAFDLIVLDVMLPGRDGIEVLHTLRTQGSKTPVLLLTAKDVLPKPAGHQVHVFVATVRQTWRFVDGLRSLVSSSLGLSGNATNSSKTRKETTMISYRKARYASAIATLIVGVALSHAQSNSPLRLDNTIPLPDVKGRIDHLAFDADNERLFVAALGNNTVEVIDVKSAKVIRTITGLAEPQGVIYQPERKRLWVANASDGKVRIFDALTFQPLRSIELGDDADNIRRDAATQRIFVGYGSGGIATFDSEGNKVADIKVDAHPESFQLEKNGPRMFVNLPNSQKVAVIDRTKAAVVASWTRDDAQSNFPMALDEADGRLFIVCRKPAVLMVLDTRSGTVVAKLPTVGDSDDVFYDQKRKRIYASGGEGAIAVYQQQDADHYSKISQLDTVKGARTSLFVPELSRLFLAVRQVGENPAAIRIYDVGD